MRAGKRKLGACAAFNEKNKQQKVDETLVKFENMIREENTKFNRNSPKFGVSDQTIIIKSVNVNSIISFQKRNKVSDLLNDDPEILAIVDTRVKEHKLLRFRNKMRNTFGTNTDQRGVAIIANRTLNPKFFSRDEEEGNYLAITFMNSGKKYCLLAIYGPNEDDDKFWSIKIDKQLEELRNEGVEKIILCGDLNIPLGKQIGYAGIKLKKKSALIQTMEKYNLEDTTNNQVDCSKLNVFSFWRRKHDRRINDGDENYQAARLDHFLTDLPLNETSVKYLRYYPSDHAIVMMKIKTNTRAGKKTWKLNPQVLDDEKTMEKLVRVYKKLTKNLMKRISQIEMSRLSDEEQAKLIRNIAYAKWKSTLLATKMITNTWARENANKKGKLKKFLNKAKENLNVPNEEYEIMSEELREYEVGKSKIKTELVKVKNKIENKTLIKYKAMKNQASRTIKELKIGGETYSSDEDIRTQMNAHFTSTFRCDCDYNKNEELCLRCRRGDTSFVKNIIPGKKSRKMLSENDVKDLEKDITEDELDKYVKKYFRKEGKSPRPDGLPYIFIFKMWTHLKKIIMTLLIKSFKLKEFNKELSEGLIVFLHKNGKPANEIKGWRPLTLLNSIYKIASGVLAQRVKKLINKITHEHQYGFVSGKNASDMVELLRKIMNSDDQNDLHTVLLALDFKGAFDTVRHEAIIRALKMKGFGPKFIKWIAALLANNESKLVINGRTSDDYNIKVKRSARQGDPLSPYLFILVLDELLERMDNDEILEGIAVGNKIINSLAFADDNYTAIVDTIEGIKSKVARIIKVMEKFKKSTGLTINVTKSEILCNNKTVVKFYFYLGFYKILNVELYILYKS